MDDTLIIPGDKALGCLPRKSTPGDWCRLMADDFDPIPRDKWKNLIGNVSLRSFVKQILDQDGVGCHDEKTQVLTENGWQDWTSYDKASALGTINPLTHALEFQMPTDLHAYDYEGPMKVLEHRSSDFMVTPNHRMYVRPWDEKNRSFSPFYQMCTADRLGWYCGLMAAPTGYHGVEIESVRFDGDVYSGDDFIALLAVIVSDGYVADYEKSKNKISFCCFNANRIDSVRNLATRMRFREQPGRPGVWYRCAPEMSAWLKANIYTCNTHRAPYKRIPAFMKSVSMRQIRLFLDSFGDKNCHAGRRAFTTTSTQLADDIQELLLRIGKRSGLSTRSPRTAVMKDGRTVTGTHNEITISEWTESQHSITRKMIGEEYYKGTVFCATVPNSTLITRRNGKVLISGNSCATESATQGVMVCRERAGLQFELLNPWSIYRVTSGGRDQGSSLDENLKFVRDIGILPESYWPRSKGWKATPPDGWKDVAAKYRLAEFWDIQNVTEAGSALLMGFPVAFGWQGHSCLLTTLLSDTVAEYANSWGEWGDHGFGKIKLSSINFKYGCFAYRVANQVD